MLVFFLGEGCNTFMCRWCPDTCQRAWRWSGGKLWPLQPRVRVYCGYEEGGEMAGGRGEGGELKRWPSRVGSATATAIVNSRGIP